MGKQNRILLLSSLSQDILLSKKGEVLRRQKGGPALFIQSVFDKEKIVFRTSFQPELEVEILITDKGEFGKVNSSIEPVKIDWASINQPTVVISNILSEFNLEDIDAYKGQVFIDVQGYVRDGSDFGIKKFWDIDLTNFFCVKGTKEEISFLPKNAVNKQKKKMLLITNGSNGSTLYFKGRKLEAKPTKKAESIDTIGSGDSFFAYFIAKYLKTNNPQQSLNYATRKTSSFLSSKTHHTNPF